MPFECYFNERGMAHRQGEIFADDSNNNTDRYFHTDAYAFF